MVRLSGLVSLLWMIILLGACRNDDDYGVQKDGPVLVKLLVSTSDASAPLSGGADVDSQISSVYILQFYDNNGQYGALHHVAQGKSATGSGAYTADLLQSMDSRDTYKLVILANLPSYGFLYGLYGKSYQDVQQACLSALTTDPLVFDGSHPFPMFGVVNGGASVEVNQNSVYTGVTKLVRAVARVDIGIGTPAKGTDGIVTSWSGNNATPFVMTDIQVWKAGKSYTYMPAKDKFHWTSVTSGGQTSDEIVIDSPTEAGAGITTKSYGAESITNGTYSIGRIYLPEAFLSWGNVYDGQHTNRLAIIVGGKYKGSPDISYYRVDFTNDNTGEKMDILRNHIYQFTISSVNAAGYTSAELAYKSKPKSLGFNATIEPWTEGTTTSVSSFLGYNLTYQGFNGEKVDWTYAAGSLATIPIKNSIWDTKNPISFDYNNFYKEGQNLFAPDIMGGQNGRLYATVPDAFTYEGTFPNLMVSANDVVDETGNETSPWKTGTTLTAFDLCRNLEEYGYDDWRLPRLSELAFIYLNQGSLNKLRGFTPLSGSYWCGSEYLVPNPGDMDQYKSGWAWAVDFATGYASGHPKTDKLKIRCVRQSANNE